MSKDLPLVGEQVGQETSQSDIVYLGVDVAHGHKLAESIHQINQFKDVNVRAWFCDIVHTPNQTPYALHLREQIDLALKERSPELKPKDIMIRLNIESAHTFKARDKMYEIINSFRQKGAAQEVNYKDPSGRVQEIEY
jgi:hypothetical protein